MEMKIIEKESFENEIKRIGRIAVIELLETTHKFIIENKNMNFQFDFIKLKEVAKQKAENLKKELANFSDEIIYNKFTNGTGHFENIPLNEFDTKITKILIKITNNKNLREKAKKFNITFYEEDFKYLEVEKNLFERFEKYNKVLGNLKDFYLNKPFKEFIQHCRNNGIHLYFQNQIDYHNFASFKDKVVLDEKLFDYFNQIVKKEKIELYYTDFFHRIESDRMINRFEDLLEDKTNKEEISGLGIKAIKYNKDLEKLVKEYIEILKKEVEDLEK